MTTGEKTGTVDLPRPDADESLRRAAFEPDTELVPTGEAYILAAHIQGKVELPPPIDDPSEPGRKETTEKKPIRGTVNVVLTTDVDMLSQAFFALREQGESAEVGVHFRFDNVTFVLNILDELAGDDRFIEIRKRRPAHHIAGPHRREDQGGRRKKPPTPAKIQQKYEDRNRRKRTPSRKNSPN